MFSLLIFLSAALFVTEEIELLTTPKKHNKLTFFSTHPWSFYAGQEKTCC